MDSVFLTDSCDCFRNSAKRSALDTDGFASTVVAALRALDSTAGFCTVGVEAAVVEPDRRRASSCFFLSSS